MAITRRREKTLMRRMDGMLEVEGDRREKMGVVLIAGDFERCQPVKLWSVEKSAKKEECSPISRITASMRPRSILCQKCSSCRSWRLQKREWKWQPLRSQALASYQPRGSRNALVESNQGIDSGVSWETLKYAIVLTALMIAGHLN